MTTERLKSLSREQQLLHDEYLALAISFGISTEPADRSRTEAAFRQMYAWLDQLIQSTTIGCCRRGSTRSVINAPSTAKA